MTQKVPFSLADIATLYGKHYHGDTDVSAYLQANDFDLAALVGERTQEQHQPDEQAKSQQRNANVHFEGEFPPVKERFDFPIYTVESSQTIEPSHKQTLNDASIEQTPENTHPTTQHIEAGQFTKPEIEPWPTLWNKLQHVLSGSKMGKKLNVKSITKRIAAGKSSIPLDYKPSVAEPSELYIYIDLGWRNHGAAYDAVEIASRLEKQLVNTNVVQVQFPQGPEGEWYVLSGNKRFDRGVKRAQDFLHESLPVPDLQQHANARCLIISSPQSGTLSNTRKQTYDAWLPLVKQMAANQITPVWLALNAPYAVEAKQTLGQILHWGRVSHPLNARDTQQALQLLTALMATVRMAYGSLLRALIQTLQLPACLEPQFWQQAFMHYDPPNDKGEFDRSVINRPDSAYHLSAFCDKKDDKSNVEKQIEQKINKGLALIDAYLMSRPSVLLHEHRIIISLLNDQWQKQDIEQSHQYFATMGYHLDGNPDEQYHKARFLTQMVDVLGNKALKAPEVVKQTLIKGSAYGHQFGLLVPEFMQQQVHQYLVEHEEEITEKGEGNPLSGKVSLNFFGEIYFAYINHRCLKIGLITLLFNR